MYLYSDLKQLEILGMNKKKLKENSHREVSIYNFQNLNKNIDDLKDSLNKKNLFLDKYSEKEKLIEEKLKAFDESVKKKENDLKNRNSKNLIKILNRVISSSLSHKKRENDLFLTNSGDFGKNKNKNFNFYDNYEILNFSGKKLENDSYCNSKEKVEKINLLTKLSIDSDINNLDKLKNLQIHFTPTGKLPRIISRKKFPIRKSMIVQTTEQDFDSELNGTKITKGEQNKNPGDQTENSFITHKKFPSKNLQIKVNFHERTQEIQTMTTNHEINFPNPVALQNNNNQKKEMISIVNNSDKDDINKKSQQKSLAELRNQNSAVKEEDEIRKPIFFSSPIRERRKTPSKIKRQMTNIFDKKLGSILNIDDSPHKRRLSTFKVNVGDLENFILSLEEEKEKNSSEEKKKAKEKNEQEYQKKFVMNMLDDMKKKVFFMKNIVDYIYPKVIVNKVNCFVEAAKNKNIKKTNFINYMNSSNLRGSSHGKSKQYKRENTSNINSNFNIFANSYSSKNNNSLDRGNMYQGIFKTNEKFTFDYNMQNKSLNSNKNIVKLDPNDYYNMNSINNKVTIKIQGPMKLVKQIKDLPKISMDNLNNNSLNQPEFTNMLLNLDGKLNTPELHITPKKNKIITDKNSKKMRNSTDNFATAPTYRDNIPSLETDEGNNFMNRNLLKSPKKRKDFVSEYLSIQPNKFSEIENMISSPHRKLPILEAIGNSLKNRVSFDNQADDKVINLMSLRTDENDYPNLNENHFNLKERDLKKKHVRILSPMKIRNIPRYEMN